MSQQLTRQVDQRASRHQRLVVVSHRLPLPQGEGQSLGAGGLVTGLLPAMQSRGGMWLGWSGEATDAPDVRSIRSGALDLVAVDLTPEAIEGYYHGYSNATLWPRLHGLESRARYSQEDYEHYREVNRRFALTLRSRLLPGETVWVHDYQLIPLGQELRALGWEGPTGYFHHVPIPAPNMWRRIPHARSLAAALRQYSHIGVQTERDARHLRAILGRNAPPIEVHPI